MREFSNAILKDNCDTQAWVSLAKLVVEFELTTTRLPYEIRQLLAARTSWTEEYYSTSSDHDLDLSFLCYLAAININNNTPAEVWCDLGDFALYYEGSFDLVNGVYWTTHYEEKFGVNFELFPLFCSLTALRLNNNDPRHWRVFFEQIKFISYSESDSKKDEWNILCKKLTKDLLPWTDIQSLKQLGDYARIKQIICLDMVECIDFNNIKQESFYSWLPEELISIYPSETRKNPAKLKNITYCRHLQSNKILPIEFWTSLLDHLGSLDNKNSNITESISKNLKELIGETVSEQSQYCCQRILEINEKELGAWEYLSNCEFTTTSAVVFEPNIGFTSVPVSADSLKEKIRPGLTKILERVLNITLVQPSLDVPHLRTTITEHHLLLRVLHRSFPETWIDLYKHLLNNHRRPIRLNSIEDTEYYNEFPTEYAQQTAYCLSKALSHDILGFSSTLMYLYYEHIDKVGPIDNIDSLPNSKLKRWWSNYLKSFDSELLDKYIKQLQGIFFLLASKAFERYPINSLKETLYLIENNELSRFFRSNISAFHTTTMFDPESSNQTTEPKVKINKPFVYFGKNKQTPAAIGPQVNLTKHTVPCSFPDDFFDADADMQILYLHLRILSHPDSAYQDVLTAIKYVNSKTLNCPPAAWLCELNKKWVYSFFMEINNQKIQHQLANIFYSSQAQNKFFESAAKIRIIASKFSSNPLRYQIAEEWLNNKDLRLAIMYLPLIIQQYKLPKNVSIVIYKHLQSNTNVDLTLLTTCMHFAMFGQNPTLNKMKNDLNQYRSAYPRWQYLEKKISNASNFEQLKGILEQEDNAVLNKNYDVKTIIANENYPEDGSFFTEQIQTVPISNEAERQRFLSVIKSEKDRINKF